MADIGLGARSGQDGVVVETFWESFRLDPRLDGNALMRASDADRELVRTVLVDSYGDGRLTREEYDERLNDLYGSRTLGELPALVADLIVSGRPPAVPAPLHPADLDLRTRGARKWRRDVEESFAAFLFPSAICVVIWIVVGGGFFWPVFPMVFLGLNLLKTVVQRESAIEREVARLEQQAAGDALPGSPASHGDQEETARE
jgi:uncharacterized protein DUF1707